MSNGNARGSRLIIPPNIPTFDCDEVVYIEPMGDRLKFYYAGPVPIAKGNGLVLCRQTKLAMIWPIASMAKAFRQAEVAAQRVMLLKPDDDMGEPEGHG